MLATLVSVLAPGTGLVWADRYSSGWRWWLVTAFGLMPVLVLANVAPAASVPVAWGYTLGSVALIATQLVVTWRGTREVRAWRGRRAVGFAIVSYLVMLGGTSAARRWLAEPFRAPGSAMAPSVVEGDQFFVPKLRRDLALARGAVVVYRGPAGLAHVGRVVGLPGDVVEVHGNTVTVNGVAAAGGGCPDVTIEEVGPPPASVRSTTVEPCLEESLEGRRWRIANAGGSPALEGRWDVEPGHAFILKDRRAHSMDSRTASAISVDDVLGPALAVWVSFPPGGWWPRWNRIGATP